MNNFNALLTLKNVKLMKEHVFRTLDGSKLNVKLVFARQSSFDPNDFVDPIFSYLISFDKNTNTLSKLVQTWDCVEKETKTVYKYSFKCKQDRFINEEELYRTSINDILIILNNGYLDNNIDFYCKEIANYYNTNIDKFIPEGSQLGKEHVKAIVGACIDEIFTMDSFTGVFKKTVDNYVKKMNENKTVEE